MRALVTGATGFIGEPLCRQLLADGAFVRGATRHGERRLTATDTVVIDAIDDRTDWTAALRGVDTVFHLAAIAHVVGRTRQNADSYERVNADGTERLARESARAGVTRFVLLSTLKINGEESAPEGFREADPVRPEGPYAISKLHAEQRLTEVSTETGLSYTIVRPPLVYGPRVRANFLSLLRAIDRRRPLPFASVRARRSLIYVENLCSALRRAATHPNAAGEIFLASDGNALPLPELVRCIARAFGRPACLMSVSPTLLRVIGTVTGAGDTIRKLTASLVVDDSKIRTTLGWNPPQNIDQGLAATVAWYQAICKGR